jgi:hypothetical protein
MATIQYIHNRMINEALAMIVLAPKGDSSLQNRVAKILKCSLGIQENDFPDDLKEHWRKIASVRRIKIRPEDDWRPKEEAKARSLTRKQAHDVLESFLAIAGRVTRLLALESGHRR